MNELLTLLNLCVGLAVLGVVAVLFHKTRRIHVKLFALEDEIRSLRTTESANHYRQVQAFIGLRDLMDFAVPLPPLRMWAASPDFLLVIARHALTARPRVVVECSSGSSTVVLAQAARISGTGHVYSLEHDPVFAAETRAMLADQGLSDWATVIDAPLVPVTLGGETFRWYDDTGLKDLGPIDMLVIDGPPLDTNALARYPAGPRLLPRLAPGGAAFLDDAARPDETKAVARWQDAFPHLVRSNPSCEKGCVRLTAPGGAAAVSTGLTQPEPVTNSATAC
ncbi:putative O-methyltransferase YrrM [Skermanella aerolata]|uniref:class I SAM-dependent methyltransferase n=1 Tax=Skermanella aerolata TaxID=393310 RepID=UPI003D1FFB9A